MQSKIFDAVKSSTAIPSVPQVVLRFLEITQDVQFDYKQLVDLLGTDPGMTGQILSLANSSLFGVSRRITSLRQGMTLLGVRRIRSLVLARYIISAIDPQAGNVDVKYFWRRSLTTAILAAKMAGHRLSEFQEEVFVAALLADVGVVILSQGLDQSYEPVAQQYRPDGCDKIHLLEEQVCGCSHDAVSAWLLDHWQLPEMIVEAVRFHHQYDGRGQLDPAIATMANLIDAADRIAKPLWDESDIANTAETCQQAMQLADLPLSMLPGMLDQIEQTIEELAGTLRVDAIPGSIRQAVRRMQEQLPGNGDQPDGA